jgi:hypothetical protein
MKTSINYIEQVYDNGTFIGFVNKKNYTTDSKNLKTLISVECEYAPEHIKIIPMNSNIQIR